MGLLDFPWLTDSLKKRALRYLLQRYLGHFLSEKLTLEQLSVDLYDGRGSITNLNLDVEGLNEELLFLPFKFKPGCTIDSITCSIPWSSLLTDSCSLEINGAKFRGQVVDKNINDIDPDKLLESSSYLSKSMMSSSMQMAEEIVTEEDKFEGLELMAQLIDSVLRRVKLVVKNTSFILESNEEQKIFTATSQRLTKDDKKTLVEFRIKHLRCEEEGAADNLIDGHGQQFNKTESSTTSNNVPGEIDKLITFQGTDVLIDSRTVCTIGGTHSIRIKANSVKSDLNIHLGNPLLAIMTSLELDKFLSVFTPEIEKETSSSSSRKIMSEQEMTSRDFARVERQLQEEVYSSPRSKSVNPVGNLIGTNTNNWSGSSNKTGTSPPGTFPVGWSGEEWQQGIEQQTMKFLPIDELRLANHHEKDEQFERKFNCLIKIPGIYLIVLPKDEPSPPTPVVASNNLTDFNKINQLIDTLIKEKDHLRFLSFPIEINASQSTISITAGDLLITEHQLCSSTKSPQELKLIWSEDDESSGTRFKMEIKKNEANDISSISFAGVNGITRMTLDPTILERIGMYWPASDGQVKKNSKSPSSSDESIDFNITAKCIKLDWLFPVPDLRSDEKLSEQDEVISEVVDEGINVIDEEKDEESSDWNHEDASLDVDEAKDLTLDIDASKTPCKNQKRKKSKLRKEVCQSVIENINLTTNLKITSATFDTFKGYLLDAKADDGKILFMDATRNAVEPIEVLITSGPGVINSTVNEENVNYFDSIGGLEDSVYIANNSNKLMNQLINDTFMMKRRIFTGNYESVIGPSDRTNTLNCLNQGRSLTNLQVDINIPNGTIVTNVDTLNVVYNRFGNDLIMWSPLNNDGHQEVEKERKWSTATSGHQQSYFMCKSGLMSDSLDSDSSFHSIDGTTGAIGGHHESSKLKKKNKSVICVNVQEITFDGLGSTDCEQQFKERIIGQNVLFGSIIGSENETKNTIFLNSSNVSLIKINSSNSSLPPKEVIIESNHLREVDSSLDITFDIHKESPELKRIKVAIGLSNVLLHSKSADTFDHFKFIWKLINVTDEEILGYFPPKIVTELHVGITNGAINIVNQAKDHNLIESTRPAIITFDDIYLTTKVVDSSATTMFRLILEEVSLFFIKSKSLINPSKLNNLRNYIRIIAAGLTDINIKITDPIKSNLSSKESTPKDEDVKFNSDNLASKLELTVSSSGVNVTACCDSLNALKEFILFMATRNQYKDGQLNQQFDEEMEETLPPAKDNETIVRDVDEAMADDVIQDDESLDQTSDDRRESVDLLTGSTTLASSPPISGSGSSPDESSFFVLGEDDVGAGISKPGREPQVRLLSDSGIDVVDNHFGPSKARVLPEMVKETLQRYLLDELSIIVNIFGGKDFEDDDNETDESSSKEDKLVVDMTNDKSSFGSSKVRYSTDDAKDNLRVRFADDKKNTKDMDQCSSHMWESLDLMSSPGVYYSKRDGEQTKLASPMASNLASAASSSAVTSKGGRFRNNDVCVQLYVSKAKALFETFDASFGKTLSSAPTFDATWRFILMIHEIEIRDKLINSSINKMLYEFSSNTIPRRNHVNMINVRAIAKINPDDGHEEVDIKVSAKPLRVNIDQDTLMFLVDFFNNLDHNASVAAIKKTNSKESMSSSPPNQVNCDNLSNNSVENEEVDEESSENVSKVVSKRRDSSSSVNSKPPAIYVKSFIFSPDVPIRLDYQGKRVDFDQGALQGILMGLAQLNQSELRLKRLCNKHGILGLDRVFMYAINEWTRDVRRHQLPSLLGGVGPVHSFVQLFQGMKDLIWMPIDQYKKDKRIVRGIQKGASSFSNSTAMAVLDLANQFVHLVQNAAQFAHDVVSPNSYHHQQQKKRRSNNIGGFGGQFEVQPRDVHEGLSAAYATLTHGANEVYRNLSAAASKGADTDNPLTGTIGCVVKEVPSVPFQTVVALTNATGKLLTGTRNQITPDARVDHEKKWKRRDSTEHR